MTFTRRARFAHKRARVTTMLVFLDDELVGGFDGSLPLTKKWPRLLPAKVVVITCFYLK